MNETLRVNGTMRLVRDAERPASMAFQGKLPKLAIAVDIQEVFSHCPARPSRVVQIMGG